MQGFLGVPLTSADRIKERRKVMQANSRSKQPQEFLAEIYILKQNLGKMQSTSNR